ncbi:MAG: diaminopimelate epimerase [Desulfobacteraceae bacterium]|nr:diaminopimelate epimerase [Desulfobacteraceae bacterium]
MSGAGNDFIVIDNRSNVFPRENTSEIVSRLCRRKVSVGANGLFLLEKSETAHIKWQFFNADGSNAEMCGNGARCAARFAYLTGMTGDELTIETIAGIIGAKVYDDRVRIKMTDPQDLVLNQNLTIGDTSFTYGFVNTGVPHVVIQKDTIEDLDIKTVGRSIRMHPRFAPAGTNVNFISPLVEAHYEIRTYERGVEDETLACGTGNVAAALVLACVRGAASPMTLKTRSGSFLKVYFRKNGENFNDICLEGDARVICIGEFDKEAWNYP